MILNKLPGFVLVCFPSLDPLKMYLMEVEKVSEAPETNLRHDWIALLIKC